MIFALASQFKVYLQWVNPHLAKKEKALVEA